ncbi:PAS domain S-box protein [Arcobacteraceae bacterium]|nr:PAS domain S-box protein [Arcobacteraceae bacterium]
MTNIELLKDSNQVIKSNFFNHSPTSAFIWNNDEKWSVVSVSKNITNLLGYAKKDFLFGKIKYSSLIHPSDIKRVSKEVEINSLDKKIQFKHKAYRIQNIDGNYIWIDDYTTIIYDNDIITHYIGYISDCTKSQNNIQEIKDSRKMWINAIESNGDGLWEWNIITDEVYFSKQWKKMLGFKENEIASNIFEWENRVHPEDIDRVEQEIKDYLNGKTKYYVSEHRVLCKNGDYKWVLDKGSITQYTNSGEAKVLTGTHSDIDERHKIRIEQEEIKKRFEKNIAYNKTLIDNLSFLTWLKDDKSNFLTVNKAFSEIVGVNNPDSLIGKNDFDIWSKKLATQYLADDKYVLKNGKNKFIQEKVLVNKKEKWFETVKAPVYDKNNNIIGTIGHSHDITERLNIEEKLTKQNQQLELEKIKLSTIIHSLPDLLWIKDENGVYLSCNNSFEKFYGAKEVDIIGKTDYDFVIKEKADLFRKNDKKAIKSDIPLSNEETVISPATQQKIYLHTTKLKVMLHDGTMYGILGIARDITQLKKHQIEIIEQKEEFETIFNSSSDGIAILDLKSNFLNCNNAYSKMLQYSKKEMLKRSCIQLTIEDDVQKSYQALDEVINNGYIKSFEKKCFTKKHQIIHISMTGTLLPDKKRILVIARDISHIKILEEQSKLAAMGEMIGNISHQWRQPLSIISTASTGVLVYNELNQLTDKLIKKNMNTINDNAQYLSKTIDDFRNFIKNDKIITQVSIKDTLLYTFSLVKATIQNNYIELITNVEDDISIHANKNELVQSFINILNNAKDVLVDREEGKRYIIVSTRKVGNSLSINIMDSGGGIEESIIDRIFEPYFTTKHQSVGTGIGLSMVNKILRDKYKATIRVYNTNFTHKQKDLYGACFNIILFDHFAV